MRQLLTRLVATGLVATLALTGCSQENDSTDANSQDPVVVEVTVKDGTVSPNGDRVKAGLGQPITFRIDADAPGELHVHSTPDRSIEFEAGQSEDTFTLDKPGVVEVELHEPPVVVVQLQIQ